MPEPRHPRPVGIAVLGYGAMAEIHATALRSLGARLVSIAGPNAERRNAFAERHGFEVASPDAIDAIKAPAVELVVVASPNRQHAEQARLALSAGRHALVEIPLAMSLVEGESLASLAVETGLQLGVCHTWAYHESYRQAIVALGERPRLHVVAASLLRRRSDVGWMGVARSWTDDLLWHHGGHILDLTMRLLGSANVTAQAAIGRPPEGSRPVDYAIAMATPDGRIGSIALSYSSLVDRTEAMVITEDLTVVLRRDSLHLSNGEPIAMQEGAFEAAVRDQDAAFLAAIDGGPVFLASAESILPTLRLQAAIDAIARDQPQRSV